MRRPAAPAQVPKSAPDKDDKQRRLNPIKLRQMKDRQRSIEDEITRLEVEIADFEQALSAYQNPQQSIDIAELLGNASQRHEKSSFRMGRSLRNHRGQPKKLYLTEQNVLDMLPMSKAVELVDKAFRQLAAGTAVNHPRRRVILPTGSVLHYMAAGTPEYFGIKVYSTNPKSGAHFEVLLYRSEDGMPLATIEANHLGQIRTGAASGVATKYLARENLRCRRNRRQRIPGRNATRSHRERAETSRSARLEPQRRKTVRSLRRPLCKENESSTFGQWKPPRSA